MSCDVLGDIVVMGFHKTSDMSCLKRGHDNLLLWHKSVIANQSYLISDEINRTNL
jgi:hypothetical protein